MVVARLLILYGGLFSFAPAGSGVVEPVDDPEIVATDGQPLGANITRLLEALDSLGAPLQAETAKDLGAAVRARDARRMQKLLDPHVLFVVSINPESRVKVARGPAQPVIQQHGFTPLLVKVLNLSTVTKPLRATSPQSGPVYAGVAELSMKRQGQERLRENENTGRDPDRFLHIELFDRPPMLANLSGLEVEYAIVLVYSSESGRREATIAFDVGQGTQDIGFRGEVPILFQVRPAVPVRLAIRDDGGARTAARLVFRDAAGHVMPPQPKRLAPDLFFQQQIYRHDGETVLLPPGPMTVEFSRGPEYRVKRQTFTVPKPAEGSEPKQGQDGPGRPLELAIQLERWVNPAAYGFYSGDHHIHGAGCAHYTSPTEGVSPTDMFRQVKGEGLNVGCVLTWGPCFDFQRQYFRPHVDTVSEPMTIVKYDLEISGFGSQALGHVCLLNLSEQEYPGSEGTKTRGWPTWTTPVLRWAKQQGGVTGYAHSASGLAISPASAASRLMAQAGGGGDGRLTREQSAALLLPDEFAKIDTNGDQAITEPELVAAIDRVADELPNLAVPEMDGVGAMEICVSTALGACDFISAMDTPRIQEWNMWYHILNCGFPLKVSGETDFPCMSSTRVGQGRVYVQLGSIDRLDFGAWCDGLRRGRSYVSDGYAHALEFTVAGRPPGFDDVRLDGPGPVQVRATVSFGAETPASVAHGEAGSGVRRRTLGDTVLLHGSRPELMVPGGTRKVELIVNGLAVAARDVPADGVAHDIEFTVPIERSSWVALRQFPQMHTNPVDVLVGGSPIRASRRSAEWCIETIRQLWRTRERAIAAGERHAAQTAFQQAIEIYRTIAAEATRR